MDYHINTGQPTPGDDPYAYRRSSSVARMHGLPYLPQGGAGAQSSSVNQTSIDYIDSVYERYRYRLPDDVTSNTYDPTDPRYGDGTYMRNTPYMTPQGEYVPTPMPRAATLPSVDEFPDSLRTKGFGRQH